MLEGLRKPTELIVIVVTLLSYGCLLQAIVHALVWMNAPWQAGEIVQAFIANTSIKTRRSDPGASR